MLSLLTARGGVLVIDFIWDTVDLGDYVEIFFFFFFFFFFFKKKSSLSTPHHRMYFEKRLGAAGRKWSRIVGERGSVGKEDLPGMPELNLNKTYDAIVVGSGAAGGMAAKELTEGGMEVLLLEAGPPLDPTKDFLTHRWPYEMPFRGFGRPGDREKIYPHQWTADEYSRGLYIDEREHPYTTPSDRPYMSVRSRFVGGKMLHWGHNARRLGHYDFRARDRDGYGENWPITYAELAPFYDKVESFVGVAGSVENIAHLPDGKYLPPFPLNCGERIVQKVAPSLGLGMRVISKRAAQRTRSIHGLHNCHYCGSCGRGCDAGAFWNSISDTLPAAGETGRLTLRPNSVVSHFVVDGNGRPKTILFVDRDTKKAYEAKARVFVLGASALESTRIMLNSVSRFWPNGIG